MNTVDSLKLLLLAGGAGWVLWLLALLSVGMVAIALERWWYYRRATGDLHALALGLSGRLRDGEVEPARAWLLSSSAVAARIAAAGLQVADLGPAAVEKAMQSRTALEREDLERRLAYLGTLGNNAPFLGLLGTVIGVIQAFEELALSTTAPVPGTAGAQVVSGGVLSAIAEALVATAVGIAVALPAVAAYNYLQRRAQHLLSSAEVLSSLVLAFIAHTPLAPARPPPRLLPNRWSDPMAAVGGSDRGIIAGINITPLVDIVLVLLLIFMVTAKLTLTPAVPVDLPQAATGESIETPFSVVLPADGRLLVDGEPLADLEQLEARAQQALRADAQLRTVIQADGALPHRSVIAVLDALRRAGVLRIAFGALPSQDESTPAAPPAL